MAEPLDSLVAGWKRHFTTADQAITWMHAELELATELAPGVWLAGCVDAVGRTSDGELFFGEWKTANPREKKTWKQVWRMNPQSLSYGLLAASRWPEMRRFTVRKAFKEQMPTYDHAWFRYSDQELEHWRSEIIGIAEEIKRYHALAWVPWPTNFDNCFRFGPNYVCPFFETGCNKQQWAAIPSGATVGGDQSWHFTSQRQRILDANPEAIVLSPTTVKEWFACREKYRKQYVELVTPAAGEAVKLGGDFHHEIAEHVRGLIKPTQEAANG